MNCLAFVLIIVSFNVACIVLSLCVLLDLELESWDVGDAFLKGLSFELHVLLELSDRF